MNQTLVNTERFHLCSAPSPVSTGSVFPLRKEMREFNMLRCSLFTCACNEVVDLALNLRCLLQITQFNFPVKSFPVFGKNCHASRFAVPLAFNTTLLPFGCLTIKSYGFISWFVAGSCACVGRLYAVCFAGAFATRGNISSSDKSDRIYTLETRVVSVDFLPANSVHWFITFDARI